MTTTTTLSPNEPAPRTEMEAKGISPDLLATMLSSASSFGPVSSAVLSSSTPTAAATSSSFSPQTDVLVVDCRPFMLYNQAHVLGAVNAHCPTILKRRSGGFVALENVVPDPHQRQRLQDGEYAAVVVYDQSTSELASARADSNLYAVVKSIGQQVPEMEGRVFFLVGGYDAFSEECPVLCVTPQFSLLVKGRCDLLAVAAADDKPVEIVPHLWLGNGQHAKNLELLQRLGISALVNVSTSCPNQYPHHFRYLTIPVRDNSSEDLLSWFDTANRFIDEVRSEGGLVLVHCQAGRSRSATVCMAYLMRTLNLTLDGAFEHVRSRREVVDPNLNFLRQLQDYRRQLDSAGPEGLGRHTHQRLQQLEEEEMCLECDRLSPPVSASVMSSVGTRSLFSFNQTSLSTLSSPSISLDLSHGEDLTSSPFSSSFLFPPPPPTPSLPSDLLSSRSPSSFSFSESLHSASPDCVSFSEPPRTPRAPPPAPLGYHPSNTSSPVPVSHDLPPPSPSPLADVHCFFAFPDSLSAFRYPFGDHEPSPSDAPSAFSLAATPTFCLPATHARTPDLGLLEVPGLLPRTPEISLSS